MSADPLFAPAWQSILDQVRSVWSPNRFREVGIVVGVSGGADSVCLLRAIEELRRGRAGQGDPPARGFVIAAHFNHGLRGENSDADQDFVQQLAERRGMRFVTRRAPNATSANVNAPDANSANANAPDASSTFNDASGSKSSSRFTATKLASDTPGEQPERRDVPPVSDEASMSRQRMAFLTETAKQYGARYITLGHSRDDNVETVLHHLFRGTGPAGLAGIGDVRSIESDLVLMRPLLSVDRQSIRDALTQIGQAWREDESNQSTLYTRNWIRGELLPLIQTRYPGAVDAVSRAIAGQRQWRSTMEQLAQDWSHERQISDDPAVFHRDFGDDQGTVILAMQHLWRSSGWPRGGMSGQHWSRLADCFISAKDERFSLPGEIDVVARGSQIQIARLPTPNKD
ncbi:tRNA(Ile)-lysidine synthase [Rubripirellula amarantea]|uniref:tRNA(Ile)-lysidine synthase n=1 Tax=Rubripirellula amarantea TaxID=2527999 RepID=A0A5C5WTL6_9BACT|nr:tRNA lysidine(34) synthetase TilS [Rubripirellula amarantea]TWT53898.1 tRNA(Ile)-lysidine synthase [Rubripirellula amarantea]